MSLTYADLVDARRLMPEAYTSQPTETMPALAGDVLEHLAADLNQAAAYLVVPELERPGRHRADEPTRPRAADGYWPLTRAEVEAIRDRVRRSLPGGPDATTGLIPAVIVTEVDR